MINCVALVVRAKTVGLELLMDLTIMQCNL